MFRERRERQHCTPAAEKFVQMIFAAPSAVFADYGPMAAVRQGLRQPDRCARLVMGTRWCCSKIWQSRGRWALGKEAAGPGVVIGQARVGDSGMAANM